MRLIGRHKLNHSSPDACRWLRGWASEVSSAHWKGPEDVIFQFPRAMCIKPGFFVFSVADLNLSLELNIVFPQGIACVIDLRENNANGS